MCDEIAQTFIEKCIAGEALISDIDDFIDKWHNLTTPAQPLHEYLGMTWEEYSVWGARHDLLSSIIADHRMKQVSSLRHKGESRDAY